MKIWLICLIGLATILNYLDRSAISFAILPMQKDLHLNDEQFGLAASGFGIGYLAVSLFAGLLVDRFGSIVTWGFAAILWSIVTFCTSFVENLTVLFSLRVLLGVVESIHFPALLKTIADWIDPKWIARSLSLTLLGVPVASLIGSPSMTYLIGAYGWRRLFIVLALMGLLWALSWFLFFKGRKNRHYHVTCQTPHPSTWKDWKPFFSSAPFLANCVIYFIFGYIVFFALFWIPGYLQQTFHLNLSQMGWAATLPWLLSSVCLLAGGGLSDYLMKKTGSIRKSRTLILSYALLLAAIFFFFLSQTEKIESALLLVSLGLGLSFGTNAPIYAINADLFPKRVGTAQGIMSSFFALSGFVAPYTTGWLVQVSGDFKSAIFLVSLLSAIGGMIGLLFQKAEEKVIKDRKR